MNFPWIHNSQDTEESCQFKHAIHRCFRKKKISLVSKWTHYVEKQEAALKLGGAQEAAEQ